MNQVGGSHYETLTPEPFEVIDGWGLDFYLGCALKYIARAGHKPGSSRAEDLRKAAHYLTEAADRTVEAEAVTPSCWVTAKSRADWAVWQYGDVEARAQATVAGVKHIAEGMCKEPHVHSTRWILDTKSFIQKLHLQCDGLPIATVTFDGTPGFWLCTKCQLPTGRLLDRDSIREPIHRECEGA